MNKMHARSSPAGGFSSHRARRSETGVDPGRALDEIRELLSHGDLPAARELATASAGRHPGHLELRNAKRVLCDGRSFPIDASIRTSDRELEWLRNPPEAYRGQWVALLESKLVGASDSLEELMGSLAPEILDRSPLVVQIAA